MPRKSVHGRRSITQGEPTMKGKRNTLPLIAALVWSAAGFNILRIGLLSAVVFTVFQIFIPFPELEDGFTIK